MSVTGSGLWSAAAELVTSVPGGDLAGIGAVLVLLGVLVWGALNFQVHRGPLVGAGRTLPALIVPISALATSLLLAGVTLIVVSPLV